MRTGLITFHFAHHYGAQLQAYATMQAIRELGHDCRIIDFRLPHTTRTNELFRKADSARALVANAHTAIHYGAFKRRYDRFEAFVAEQMALSPRRYTADEELRREPPACDVYVAGSDQIWNPYIYANKQKTHTSKDQYVAGEHHGPGSQPGAGPHATADRGAVG